MTNEECAWIRGYLEQVKVLEVFGLKPWREMRDEYTTYNRMWQRGDQNLHIVVRKIRQKLKEEGWSEAT